MVDYVEYLKRHFFIGQIDPWRRTEDGRPILCLLTNVKDAIEECKNWSGEEISKQEFLRIMKEGDIFVFRNIEEFQKVKDELKDSRKQVDETALKFKRTVSEERKEKLRNQASLARAAKKGSIL